MIQYYAPQTLRSKPKTKINKITLIVILGLFLSLVFNQQSFSQSSANALDFDGVDDYVSIPISTSLMGSTPTTIEFWAKPSVLPSGVGFAVTINTADVAVRFTNSAVQLEHFGGPSFYVGNINDDCWHHFAFTWDGTTAYGFIDGAPTPNPSINVAFPATAPGILYLGVYNLQYFMKSSMDEVRIWNVQRTQAQIQATMLTELVGNETGLLSYYKFNQGIANENNSGETTLIATTGTDGTLNNFALNGATSNWVTSGALIQYPEAKVSGNGVEILDEDNTPSTADHTDFAYVANGYTVTRTYTIQNTGSEDLIVTNITAVGGDASLFSIGALTPASPVPTGGSATFTVTYTPTGTGIKNTTLHIASNDCDEADYDFFVQGNTGPNIILDFGGILDGTIGNYYNGGAGPNYGITFNSGIAFDNALSAGPNPITINFPAGFTTNFSAVGNVCIGFRIRVFDDLDGNGTELNSAICVGCPGNVLSVTFCGIGKSVRIDRFSCPGTGYDDLTFGPAPVPVPEINVQGGLPMENINDGDVSPTDTDHTDFGPVALNVSLTRTFTIQNLGTSILTVSSITSSNGLFVVSGAPTSVPANSSATFDVTFTPTSIGVQNSTININNDDCDEAVYDFAVTGTGVILGAALNFDGVNDYVTSTIPTLPVGGSPRTMECWVKINSFAYSNHIMGWGEEITGQDQFRLGYDNIRRFFFWGSNADVASTTTITTGQWYHIAVTYDGYEIKLYVNGNLEGTLQTTLATLESVFSIGNSPVGWQSHFDGVIDEVRIWNFARSCVDINQLKNCELSGSESGLVAYYNFNHGFVNVNNSGINMLDDATINNYNGTLTNFALNGATSNWTAPGGVITGTNCPTTSTSPIITPTSQEICSGDMITEISLSSPIMGTTFSWTRDNTLLVTGINSSGSENISGILTNTTNAPITVTFTITPTTGTCVGPDITATVLVNPSPVVNCPTTINTCIGTPAFVLSGATPMGGIYNGIGVSSGSFNPSVAGLGSHAITYDYEEYNCGNSCTFLIEVSAYTTIASGDYYNASNWAGGCVPPEIIPQGITIMINNSMTNSGTITNNGTIMCSTPFVNEGIYKGRGIFEGNFINRGTVKIGD